MRKYDKEHSTHSSLVREVNAQGARGRKTTHERTEPRHVVVSISGFWVIFLYP